MKKISMVLMLCLMSITMAFAKGNKQLTVFDVDLHCQACITKIEKNIAFEKGVKDLKCDLNAKTVTVIYDTEKTSVKQLREAFAKLGKSATVNTAKTEAAIRKAYGKSVKIDATTGATIKK